MKKSKWFDGAKFVPAHVGVFETANGYFRFWNGIRWGGHGVTVDRALLFSDVHDCGKSPTWRGIKK